MVMAPDYKAAARAAQNLLSEAGIHEPPVDPVHLARSIGLEVQFVDFDDEFSKVSGFYDPQAKMIVVNKAESPGRQTFTIAHELAHALLHHEWAASDEYKVLWRDSEYNGDEAHEKEANAFAARLLMPRSFLDRYFGQMNEAELSRLFAVSVPAMRNRLKFEYGI
ncbi:MAG: ImmA/IrrE family metallo-endopeptidase [Bosea sp.]|uniref:ImmA/IrrE family metallo-endopeptidase n=1 Tax=Bosea sp. (in: a-proteobacteria) TaxID=1871050 RepID=UPI002393B625|nr:ImmA/IrrE family metallo-endopeptidase [Bosea sp. (in: a-proteobacteria)]MCP4733807.1 ImmA/IrrE family metallo-endopeptidase [Bosea sp. (in: a-proteobacteria)]